MNAIPLDWIKKYVNELLEAAGKFGPDSSMGKACLNRAEIVLDMVKVFKEKKE